MKNPLPLGLLCLFLLALSATTAFAQYIYWLDADFLAPRIGRSDAAGGNATSVPLAAKSLPEGLALDPVHNKIFFSELAYAHANIQTAQPNLSGFGKIDSAGSASRGITVDPVRGKIYWATSNLSSGATILKSNLDGSGKQTLYAFAPGSGTNLRGVALLDSLLFWADFSSGKIRYGTTTGSLSPTDLVTGLNGPVGVATGQDGYIYWTEANANVIKRRTIVPGPVTTLVSGLSSPQYIAVDAASGQLFWTEVGIPRIRRANLNGSNMQSLALNVAHPTGIAASSSMTAVHPDEQTPATFALYQNYPNPFNPGTTIGFRVPGQTSGSEASRAETGPGVSGLGSSRVRLIVYDLLGREMALLVNETKDPGTYAVTWTPGNIASGIYLYRLNMGSLTETRKMMLLH